MSEGGICPGGMSGSRKFQASGSRYSSTSTVSKRLLKLFFQLLVTPPFFDEYLAFSIFVSHLFVNALRLSRRKLWIRKAQLSQRDRATLRVTEYFAKSLKVTQDHPK